MACQSVTARRGQAQIVAGRRDEGQLNGTGLGTGLILDPVILLRKRNGPTNLSAFAMLSTRVENRSRGQEECLGWPRARSPCEATASNSESPSDSVASRTCRSSSSSASVWASGERHAHRRVPKKGAIPERCGGKRKARRVVGRRPQSDPRGPSAGACCRVHSAPVTVCMQDARSGPSGFPRSGSQMPSWKSSRYIINAREPRSRAHRGRGEESWFYPATGNNRK
jgi:hypothetical protein